MQKPQKKLQRLGTQSEEKNLVWFLAAVTPPARRYVAACVCALACQQGRGIDGDIQLGASCCCGAVEPAYGWAVTSATFMNCIIFYPRPRRSISGLKKGQQFRIDYRQGIGIQESAILAPTIFATLLAKKAFSLFQLGRYLRTLFFWIEIRSVTMAPGRPTGALADVKLAH